MGPHGNCNTLLPLSLDNGLPKLETLNATPEFTNMLLVSHCDPPRPLRDIRTLQTNSELLHESRLQGIDRECIKSVALSGLSSLSELSILAHLFPNLEYLRLPPNIVDTGVWDEDIGCRRKPVTAEWAIGLASFQNLREIIGIYFLVDEEECLEENHKRIALLSRLFPLLELISGPGHHRIVRIKRHNDETITWHSADYSSPILYVHDSEY
ncbi:hypothetical protein M422DRAFT_26541 [Sphaerobolus stellatus SS14]|nr:hypothetical protein M422DRAFT_26541 [Sphaerobolus stellatus SS14]